jgi:hypothetical protein
MQKGKKSFDKLDSMTVSEAWRSLVGKYIAI